MSRNTTLLELLEGRLLLSVDGVSVGAIRWDAWQDDGRVNSEVERTLGPNKWHATRIPFFGDITGTDSVSIRGNSQAIMDQEIAYAKYAGLDYWAFVSYDSHEGMSNGLDLYLNSSHKNDIKFCILGGINCLGGATSSDLRSRMVPYFKMSNYQDVVSGRPLMYILSPSVGTGKNFTTWAAAKAALDSLRAESIAAGAGDPYVVVQGSSPSSDRQSMLNLGADAIGSYAVGGGSTSGSAYSSLASAASSRWNTQKNTGAQVVPLATAGWDRRPRYEAGGVWWEDGPGSSAYYLAPTGTELANHIQSAITWVKNNPAADPAKAVLTYAWNENDEGGWLVPTLKADGTTIDTTRIDALRTVLVPGTAPTITTQPVSQSVPAGSSVTFSVVASGSSLSYQWQRNGSNIDGATAASYMLNPVATGDNGALFRCVVSNPYGSATSNAATLTVTAAAAPTAPSGLTATGASTSQINLAWTDNASNEAGFKVERSPDGSTGWSQIGTVAANVKAYSDTSLTAGTTYYYRVRATNGVGDSSYSNIASGTTLTVASGLAGYWPLNDGTGTSAADASGGSHTGTLTNGPVWTSGPVGGALSFDGVNDYVTVPDGTGLDGMAAITVAAWIRVDQYTAQGAVAVGKDGGSNSFRLSISSGGGHFAVKTVNNAWYTAGTTADLSAALTPGTWYYVVGTYDGSMVRVYVNDVLQGSGSQSISGAIYNGTSPLYMGYKSATNVDYFKGVLDDVRIYNRALSVSEIATLMGPAAAPGGLTATAVSTNQINLAWTDNSSNETGFSIERSSDGSTWAQVASVAANVTTYANTGLAAATTYYYRLAASNSGGSSPYSNIASTTTQQVPAPAAPSGLTATGVSVSQINLAWTDNSTSEAGFKIDCSADGSTWTQIATVGANVTAYCSTGLAAGTTYYYRVRAYNAGGDSAYTAAASAATQPATAPAGPSGLAAAVASPSQINLAWTDNATDETGFRVERSADGIANWQQIGTVGPNITSYGDTGLAESATWWYRVLAYNAVGESSYSNAASAATPDVTAPTIAATTVNQGASQRSRLMSVAIQFGEAVTVEAGSLTLHNRATGELVDISAAAFAYDSPTRTATWDFSAIEGLSDAYYKATLSAASVHDAALNLLSDDYPIYLLKQTGDINGDSSVDVGDLGILATQYGASGDWWTLPGDLNADGSVDVGDLGILATHYGDDLPEILPEAPSGLTATSVSGSQIDLTWTDNANNETGFQIEQSGDGATGWTQIAAVAADVTGYSDMGLLAGASYYYRVRAGNTSGDSAWSGMASAATPVIVTEDWRTVGGVSWPSQWTQEGSALTSSVVESNGAYYGELLATSTGSTVMYINTAAAEDIDQVVWTNVVNNSSHPGFIARRADENSDTYYGVETTSTTQYDGYIFKVVDGVRTNLVAVPAISAGGSGYYMRFLVQDNGAGATDLKFKLWLSGSAQLDTWTAQYTDSTAALQSVSGRFGLWGRIEIAGSRRIWYDNYTAVVGGTNLPAPVPAAPGSLMANGASDSQIDLSWTDNSIDETGFRIERSPDGSTGWTQIDYVAANVTSYSDTNLPPDTTYYYRMRSTSSAGDSAYSNVATDATLQGSTPAAPSGLTATSISTSRIDLTWTDNSADETSFKIERSLDGSTGWTQIAMLGAGVTSYSDTGLPAATTYYYRVHAGNAAGNSDCTNIASAATQQITAPEAPSGLTATSISTSRIDLAWTDNSGNETGFVIERSPDGSTGWAQTATVNPDVTSYSDTGLTAGTTYYYRVRASNTAGNSAYSSIASAATQQVPVPAAPSGLTATAASMTQINLAWTDNSADETSFKIERSLDGSTGWTQVGTVGENVTSYSDTGLSSVTAYFYRVRASNAGGNSSYTSTASAAACYDDFNTGTDWSTTLWNKVYGTATTSISSGWGKVAYAGASPANEARLLARNFSGADCDQKVMVYMPNQNTETAMVYARHSMVDWTYYRAELTWAAIGSTSALKLNEWNGSTMTQLGSTIQVANPNSNNVWVRVKTSTVGSSCLIQVKEWDTDVAEPSTWNIEYTDATPRTGSGAQSVGLGATTGVSSLRYVMFDKYTILPPAPVGGGGAGGMSTPAETGGQVATLGEGLTVSGNTSDSLSSAALGGDETPLGPDAVIPAAEIEPSTMPAGELAYTVISDEDSQAVDVLSLAPAIS